MDEPADKISKYVGSVSLLLNTILAVVVGLINQNWHLGVNAFVCAMCITTPCYALFCTNNTLLGVSKQLRTRGAMVNGFEGASVTSDANAIVIEAQNLFGPRSCEIHGIKTFNGAKADDVILKTASVIINTKSPLASVFDDVIIGKQAILPEVDDIVYEDRLGTTGWIYRKKILVGTRDLLIHHGVPVLKEDFEKKYTRKGRKVLYLAEAGKVLPELERFIIDEVTDGIVQTRAQYDSDFKISVNITAHSLLWDIEGYIRQTMEQKEIDAHMLWIEITEQDILLQTDVVVRKLEELKKQGHKLLIDDFGMGHTSLLYLQSEYFDVVKLDGSLTRPLLKSHTNQKIVRSIIELGQELGVNVIAEFVENREQRDLLDTLGCHCYQGYLYAKPLELEEFITYMKQMNEK